MHEEDRSVPDGAVSPCGHRNAPNAHFCDACGVRLPMPCPCCSGINRDQANFCSNCGRELRDLLRTHAAPSVVPVGLATRSSARIESQSPRGARELFLPVEQAANGGTDGLDPDDSVPSTLERDNDAPVDEDAQRLKQIARFAQRRRRRESVWLWTVSLSIVLGLFGAALVRTRMAPPPADQRRLVDPDAQGGIAAPPREAASAAIVERTPASAAPPATPVRPPGDAHSPAPAGLAGAPAAAPAAPRTGGEL